MLPCLLSPSECNTLSAHCFQSTLAILDNWLFFSNNKQNSIIFQHTNVYTIVYLTSVGTGLGRKPRGSLTFSTDSRPCMSNLRVCMCRCRVYTVVLKGLVVVSGQNPIEHGTGWGFVVELFWCSHFMMSRL